MPDPSKYTRNYNYSTATLADFKSNINPEFDELVTVTDEIVEAIKDIRRSDGALVNGIVTNDSLAAEVTADLDALEATITALEASARSARDAAQAAQAAAESAASDAQAASDSVEELINIDGVAVVDTVTGLKGLDSSEGTAFIRGAATARDGGHGHFTWVSGNQSTNVTNDPGELVWVPPNSDPTGASGAWQRYVSGAYNVLWGGAAADGSTDDSAGFTGAQSLIDANSGGKGYVPFATAGYAIGDGATAGSAIEMTDDTTWEGEDTLLIHRARNAASQPRLMMIEDATKVRVSGFRVDGEQVTRNAITMAGLVDDVLIRDVHIFDCENFGLQYADTDTSTGTALVQNVSLENIRIDGTTGLSGDGSGINFFPRAGDAASKNVRMTDLYVDVTNASNDQSNHGPQALKLSNMTGVAVQDSTFIGGDIAAIILTTGVRDVTLRNVRARRANRGMQIDASVAGTAPAATTARRILVDGFDYLLDGVTTGEDYAVTIAGDPEDVTLKNIYTDAEINIQAQDAGDTLKNLTFEHVYLDGAAFRTRDNGISVTADVQNLRVFDLKTKASPNNTALEIGSANWNVSNSEFEKIYAEDSLVEVLSLRGNNNIVRSIQSHNGNTGNASTGTVVRDYGDHNTYENITISGASDQTRFFFRKTAGDGLTVKSVTGTPVNSRGFDLLNQESSEVPQGDVLVTSQEFDLSGANDTQILYVADVDTYILGVKFVYTQASSADAGTNQELRVNKSTILTYTSEINMPVFSSTNYINTAGTRSFSDRLIQAGEYLDILFGGGKTGGGQIIVQVSMVRSTG